MKIKYSRYGLAASLFFLLTFTGLSGLASAQTAGQCSTGSADARERCVEQLIQTQCSSGSADSMERCAQNIRGTGGSGSTSGGTGSNTNTVPEIGGIEREADRAFGNCPEGSETGCGLIEKYLNPAINLLSAAAGMIIIIMIIVGGIQYASSGGDASKVAAAKSRIANALIAIIAFLFLYAVLQWLVPGGLF